MASFSKNNSQNQPGSVFTDTSCIDCGTCYHLSPKTFDEISGSSVVIAQPESLKDWEEVKRAIVSCPTNSIGLKGPSALFKEAPLNLPLLISENVYYCGYAAESSFGATSYLIRHPQGNILVDSPRFHPLLVKELERLGGVQWMLLTHRDDVADHQKFHDHFSCQRIIHQDEVSSGTKACEVIWQGEEDFLLLHDLKLIKVPGHTKGHYVILYQDKYLFTGDHLFVEKNKLRSSKGVCWYSWDEQIKSTKKLLDYTFEWVLPGHGGWDHLSHPRSQLQALIESMEKR